MGALSREAKALRRAVRQVARSVSFKNAGIPTTIRTDADAFHVCIETRERDDGGSIQLQLSWKWSDEPPHLMTVTRELALDWIYRRVREAWVHELDEAMHVNGKRRRDLHNGQGQTIAPPADEPRDRYAA